eukprot:416643_1
MFMRFSKQKYFDIPWLLLHTMIKEVKNFIIADKDEKYLIFYIQENKIACKFTQEDVLNEVIQIYKESTTLYEQIEKHKTKLDKKWPNLQTNWNEKKKPIVVKSGMHLDEKKKPIVVKSGMHLDEKKKPIVVKSGMHLDEKKKPI